MNHSEQSERDARRQHDEAVVARHLPQLFRRLPMLSGFWLDPDLKVAKVVSTWTAYTDDRALYAQVTETLVQIVEECPEAAQLMHGRTFARAVH